MLLDSLRSKGESNVLMTASYFDVDGTLVTTNLVHPTLYYLMNQPTPLHSLRAMFKSAIKAPWMLRAELQDRRLFNEMLFSAFAGVSEDRLLSLSEECFVKIIKPRLYRGARDLVQNCLDRGHDVVIVSGALDFLMTHLAEHLGATDIIANKLEIKDRFCTGKLVRPVVAGPEKARLIREHARAHDHALDECFAYSDSYSDVPMLSIVGYPAAVNPDTRLELLAKTYAWPIIHLDRKAS